jgi:hypothetical protein
LSIHEHKFTFKHLCWHSITKILRNGPKAHFPFRRARPRAGEGAGAADGGRGEGRGRGAVRAAGRGASRARAAR